MKKLLFLSLILFSFSLVFLGGAVLTCGGDYFNLINYNNYTKSDLTLQRDYDINFIDCEYVEIVETYNDRLYIELYENDDVEYRFDTVKDYYEITQVGEVTGINKKGIILYLPYGTSYSNYNFTSDELFLDIDELTSLTTNISINVEELVLKADELKVSNLYINSEEAVINLEEVIFDAECLISSDELVLNVDDIKGDKFEVTSKEGVIKLDGVDVLINTINIIEGVIKVEYEGRKDLYTFNIDVQGSCNVVSGGSGSKLVNIKNKGLVKVSFDD